SAGVFVRATELKHRRSLPPSARPRRSALVVRASSEHLAAIVRHHDQVVVLLDEAVAGDETGLRLLVFAQVAQLLFCFFKKIAGRALDDLPATHAVAQLGAVRVEI